MHRATAGRTPGSRGVPESGSHELDVLLRNRLLPPGGDVSRLTALLDDPEVIVFLDDLFNTRFNVGCYVSGRHSEALRARADLLPFPLGQSYPFAALDPPALDSHTGTLKAHTK